MARLPPILCFFEEKVNAEKQNGETTLTRTMDILFMSSCRLVGCLSDDDASCASVVIRVFVWFVSDGSTVMKFLGIGCQHVLCWSGHWDAAC